MFFRNKKVPKSMSNVGFWVRFNKFQHRYELLHNSKIIAHGDQESMTRLLENLKKD